MLYTPRDLLIYEPWDKGTISKQDCVIACSFGEEYIRKSNQNETDINTFVYAV